MHFVDMLAGGDRRSLGRTEEVVQLVLANPGSLSELFNVMAVSDEVIRMRASDALEKVCRLQPAWFTPYVSHLLNDWPKMHQPSVQWHLAQILCEVPLTEIEIPRALDVLRNNLKTTDDWIVTNLTLESLATFTRRGLLSTKELTATLQAAQQSRHKSVRHRAVKLLEEFGDV